MTESVFVSVPVKDYFVTLTYDHKNIKTRFNLNIEILKRIFSGALYEDQQTYYLLVHEDAPQTTTSTLRTQARVYSSYYFINLSNLNTKKSTIELTYMTKKEISDNRITFVNLEDLQSSVYFINKFMSDSMQNLLSYHPYAHNYKSRTESLQSDAMDIDPQNIFINVQSELSNITAIRHQTDPAEGVSAATSSSSSSSSSESGSSKKVKLSIDPALTDACKCFPKDNLAVTVYADGSVYLDFIGTKRGYLHQKKNTSSDQSNLTIFDFNNSKSPIFRLPHQEINFHYDECMQQIKISVGSRCFWAKYIESDDPKWEFITV